MQISITAIENADVDLGNYLHATRPIGTILVVPTGVAESAEPPALICELVPLPSREGLVHCSEAEVIRQTRELFLDLRKLPGVATTQDELARLLKTFMVAFRFAKRLGALTLEPAPPTRKGSQR